MQEMAQAMGLWVVEVPVLDPPVRWVSDCGVILVAAGLPAEDRDAAIAWVVEQARALVST